MGDKPPESFSFLALLCKSTSLFFNYYIIRALLLTHRPPLMPLPALP